MTTFSAMLKQNIAIKKRYKGSINAASMGGVKFDEYADIIRRALTKRWGIRITKADSNRYPRNLSLRRGWYDTGSNELH